MPRLATRVDRLCCCKHTCRLDCRRGQCENVTDGRPLSWAQVVRGSLPSPCPWNVCCAHLSHSGSYFKGTQSFLQSFASGSHDPFLSILYLPKATPASWIHRSVGFQNLAYIRITQRDSLKCRILGLHPKVNLLGLRWSVH